MSNPLVTIGVLVILVALSAGASASNTGNATASTNSTGSPHKNSTEPLPPFGSNHDVGEGKGWFFDWKANASAANYSDWAANRTFYLGDYLSELSLSLIPFKTDYELNYLCCD